MLFHSEIKTTNLEKRCLPSDIGNLTTASSLESEVDINYTCLGNTTFYLYQLKSGHKFQSVFGT